MRRNLWTWFYLTPLFLGLFPLFATARTLTGNGVTLNYDDALCAGVGAAAQCNAAMERAFDKTVGQFQLDKLKDFLKFMSSAQAMSTKGQGVDYTTNPSVFVVGGSVGAAVDIGNNTFREARAALNKSGGLGASGYALQFSIMAGVNLGAFKFTSPILGIIDLNRMTVYAHAAAYDFSDLLKQEGLTVKSSQFGFHTKYKFLEARSVGFGSLNWGGLDFITGLTFSSNSLNYQKTFDEVVAGDGTLSSPQVRITPGGSIAISNNALTIPFEVATSVRMFYLLSLFGGAGIDLNFGRSSIDVALASTSMSANAGSGLVANVGDMKASAATSSGGRLGDFRFFAGAAVNLIPLKNTNLLSLVVQGNISTGGALGVMVGVRAGW